MLKAKSKPSKEHKKRFKHEPLLPDLPPPVKVRPLESTNQGGSKRGPKKIIPTVVSTAKPDETMGDNL